MTHALVVQRGFHYTTAAPQYISLREARAISVLCIVTCRLTIIVKLDVVVTSVKQSV